MLNKVEYLFLHNTSDKAAKPKMLIHTATCVIIATSLTTGGDLTAMYVERALKNLGVKITRLGRGIPTGGEIEFADPETIAAALKRRE